MRISAIQIGIGVCRSTLNPTLSKRVRQLWRLVSNLPGARAITATEDVSLERAAGKSVGSISRGQPRELGFSFIYESTTSPKGQFEFEKWVTWKNGNESGNKVKFAAKSNME